MPAGAAAYNIFSENTTETIAKFGDERADAARPVGTRQRRAHFRRFGALRHQTEPRGGGPGGTLYVFNETALAD